MSASKNVCSGPRLPDLTPICATFHSNCTKRFNVTHKTSVYFTAALCPLNLLCNSRHVTTTLLGPPADSSPQLVTYPFLYLNLASKPQHLLNVGMSATL